MISFSEAIRLVLETVQVNKSETAEIVKAAGRIAADDLFAGVNSPSVNASLKDGFAVHSEDIAGASEAEPVILEVSGTASAGGKISGGIAHGKAMRILSGAQIPDGADAVIAEEFTSLDGSILIVKNTAHAGRNILAEGSDVHTGDKLISRFSMLDPMSTGLLAAAGFDKVPVVKLPDVAIISTGDEVIAPGTKLETGKLYASNLITLASWCGIYGFKSFTKIVPDDALLIEEELKLCIDKYDMIITSGGAWNGERDLVVKILDAIGWRKIFHRVRMGPGKAAAFGEINNKPVFCLPGGPPSNHMAFIQLVLPALRKMAGYQSPMLPVRKARVSDELTGQKDWTQFVHGCINEDMDMPVFTPVNSRSRLQMLSSSDAIAAIPEGRDSIKKDEVAEITILRQL